LANTKSALKNVRKTARRNARNRVFRSRARTFIKKTQLQIEAGDLAAAQETAQRAVKALDKAAQKGIIHPNNASRRKSRLVKRLHQALQAQAE